MRVLCQNLREEAIADKEAEVHGGADCLRLAQGGIAYMRGRGLREDGRLRADHPAMSQACHKKCLNALNSD
jgi:hypothetical protein